ncbi:hypothetical protein EW146_g1605 [Bondarzewia mesenterica]|uniref:Uncharacterized protein n=1 Tax=Bondarzewia mesenterica TaxID=1095465 RepID=A0A4S4M3B1_9AGAM|nr:hypothetical protein EW146_g1605 [Bondarzewia mesenterica]
MALSTATNSHSLEKNETSIEPVLSADASERNLSITTNVSRSAINARASHVHETRSSALTNSVTASGPTLPSVVNDLALPNRPQILLESQLHTEPASLHSSSTNASPWLAGQPLNFAFNIASLESLAPAGDPSLPLQASTSMPGGSAVPTMALIFVGIRKPDGTIMVLPAGDTSERAHILQNHVATMRLYVIYIYSVDVPDDVVPLATLTSHPIASAILVPSPNAPVASLSPAFGVITVMNHLRSAFTDVKLQYQSLDSRTYGWRSAPHEVTLQNGLIIHPCTVVDWLGGACTTSSTHKTYYLQAKAVQQWLRQRSTSNDSGLDFMSQEFLAILDIMLDQPQIQLDAVDKGQLSALEDQALGYKWDHFQPRTSDYFKQIPGGN